MAQVPTSPHAKCGPFIDRHTIVFRAVLSSLEEGQASAEAHMVHQAGRRLLEHRLAQRGTPTLGDAHDAAFAALLPTLSPHDGTAIRALRDVGDAMGRHVYAKHFVDATLPTALDLVSGGLFISGGWSLRCEVAFHREARLRVDDATPMLDAYIEGVLAGYLEECFNCKASVRIQGGCVDAALGEGRDVNRRSGT